MSGREPVSDADVAAWIDEHIVSPEKLAENEGTATADQKRAAAEETRLHNIRDLAPWLESVGELRYQRHSDGTDRHHPLYHASVRRYLVAVRNDGIRSLCPHTKQIRPLVLLCDPGVIVCLDCLPRVMSWLGPAPWQHNHECDECCAHAELLSSSVSNLGNISIHAHVCADCSAKCEQAALGP